MQGLYITTKGEGAVKYNGVIDFNGKSKEDNLITLMVTPEKCGTAELRTIKLTFTDVNDTNNYLNITIAASVDDNSLYGWVKAGTKGNVLQGLYEGVLRTEPYLGCLIGQSFTGYGRFDKLSKQYVVMIVWQLILIMDIKVIIIIFTIVCLSQQYI